MALVAGTVAIADDGTETYTPDDTTNNAKALYLMLIASSSSVTMTKKVAGTPPSYNPTTKVLTPPGPPSTMVQTISVVPDVQTKRSQANLAMTMSTWMVGAITTNATVTVTIPNTTGGDGLQKAGGTPTTHPDVAKNLTGTIS